MFNRLLHSSPAWPRVWRNLVHVTKSLTIVNRERFEEFPVLHKKFDFPCAAALSGGNALTCQPHNGVIVLKDWEGELRLKNNKLEN